MKIVDIYRPKMLYMQGLNKKVIKMETTIIFNRYENRRIEIIIYNDQGHFFAIVLGQQISDSLTKFIDEKINEIISHPKVSQLLKYIK